MRLSLLTIFTSVDALIDDMTARFNEANLRAFENARESHAKCTRLIQDLSARID